MTHPRCLNELLLESLGSEAQALARTPKPLTEAPRTARRIALSARRRHARQLGNL
jgi:hypothetical protein